MNDCFITTDLFPTFFHGLDYIYAEGQIVDIYNSWGNRMSYTSWNTPQTQVSFSFHRGFTGHEHYDRIHVINANAGAIIGGSANLYANWDNIDKYSSRNNCNCRITYYRNGLHPSVTQQSLHSSCAI